MIEAAARAIADDDGWDWTGVAAPGVLLEPIRATYKRRAQVALAAARTAIQPPETT